MPTADGAIKWILPECRTRSRKYRRTVTVQFYEDYQEGLLLNEKQYRKLCEVCDRVLQSSDSSFERVAISWLHVVREHPVFLSNYTDVFEPEWTNKAIVRKVYRIIRNWAVLFRLILRSLYTFRQSLFASGVMPEKVDVLFVSHLLNSSQAGQKNDFYFGGLPHEMISRGHSSLIALINHSGKDGKRLVKGWTGGSVPRVILSPSFHLYKELTLRHCLKKESRKLKKLAKREGQEIAKRIIARASQEALSSGSLATLRIAIQIRALVAKLEPKAIVVTHEGHAWERMAFAAARTVAPRIQCIGYQHAALFRLQHAIRRNLAPQFNPDRILASGLVAKRQFETTPDLKGIPISVLGSVRSYKGAPADAGNTVQSGNAGHPDHSACLVIPEGIVSECFLLFEFSLACALSSPGIQFIWRLHPLVTHESLAAQNPRLRNLPNNIVLSEATLEEDIARSRWALYRGTTAIVQAVVAGLRPIYLQLPGEMSIDPLFELTDWRVKVATASEFQQVIKADTNRSVFISKSEGLTAKEYCKNFFLPLDCKILLDSLEN